MYGNAIQWFNSVFIEASLWTRVLSTLSTPTPFSGIIYSNIIIMFSLKLLIKLHQLSFSFSDSVTYVYIYYIFVACYVPHPPPPPSFDDTNIVFSEQCVLKFNP